MATTGLQGLRRKLVYITLYELMAIAISSLGLAAGSGNSLQRAGVAAVASSAIAVAWNLAYNALFEHWEARQRVRGRSLRRRVAHAVGFEVGFIFLLVPLFAWWLGIGWWHALVLDLGLSLFFMVYTFGFNWGFDRVFGLPASAQPLPAEPADAPSGQVPPADALPASAAPGQGSTTGTAPAQAPTARTALDQTSPAGTAPDQVSPTGTTPGSGASSR